MFSRIRDYHLVYITAENHSTLLNILNNYLHLFVIFFGYRFSDSPKDVNKQRGRYIFNLAQIDKSTVFQMSVLFFQEQPFYNFPEGVYLFVEETCSFQAGLYVHRANTNFSEGFIEQTLLSHQTDTNFPRNPYLVLKHTRIFRSYLIELFYFFKTGLNKTAQRQVILNMF